MRHTEYTNHYRQGADTNHFLGNCYECDAEYVKGMTLDQVENWYRQGVLTQDEYEGFMYAWATSAVRGPSWDNWTREPADAAALEFAKRVMA